MTQVGGTRPGKQPHNELERSAIFDGKTHYFDWAIFNSYVNVYQRVPPTRDIWVCLKIIKHMG